MTPRYCWTIEYLNGEIESLETLQEVILDLSLERFAVLTTLGEMNIFDWRHVLRVKIAPMQQQAAGR
jgi:hypothetical protein